MADERYLVLARKWRPRRFEDVVGQEHITRTLRNAITSGRIHHAFLFIGSRGIGKTTTARIVELRLSRWPHARALRHLPQLHLDQRGQPYRRDRNRRCIEQRCG
jgi:Holliday junction resolvasome RuvABC ATP-dependent DNA helicase subunit